MTLKTIAAESKSAAQERDAGKASMCRNFSTDFKRILFCDAKGKPC